MRLYYSVMVCFAVAILAAGCSGPSQLETAPVKGTVTYKGKPLTFGNVSFRPAAGSPSTGRIQADGTFTLSTYDEGDGAIIGLNQVSISATERDAGKEGEVDPNTELTVSKSLIPEKYTSFATSELTAEVKGGADNEFNFELKDR